jgi:CHASE3 domain sensor protein
MSGKSGGEITMNEIWPLIKKLFGIFLAGMILLLIIVVAYRSSDGQIENKEWANHTQIVRTDLDKLLTSIVNAETGQRGYIITGNDRYLEAYVLGLTTNKPIFEELSRLTLGNHLQQQRMVALQPLIDAKMAELKETIDIRRTSGQAAAEKVINEDEGKNLMDQIRADIRQLDQQEVADLEQHNREAASKSRLAIVFILFGGIAGAAIAAFGWFLIRSSRS